MAVNWNFANFRAVYDDLTGEVERARPQFLTDHLENWFELIDGTPGVREIIKRLERVEYTSPAMRWEEQLKKNTQRLPSTLPKDPITWPPGRELRLGLQLLTFRKIARRRLGAKAFADNFLGPDMGVEALVEHVFAPMARDLRRKLEAELEPSISFGDVEKPPEEPIPASDRTVSLDHNSVEYQEAVEALDKLEHTLVQANDYDDVEDKEQRIAEVSAVRRLLQAAKVRISTIGAVAGPVLGYLTKKFVDTGIGQAATKAFEKLTALLGSFF